jgi:hypothetical protein
MAKVLFQNLALSQQQIETKILEPSLLKIIKCLRTLYIDKTQLFVSKYAKKRIKVDLKSFICSISDPKRP